MNSKKLLQNQISNAGGNVQFTYIAHWNIVNRLKCRYNIIKILQIILTALSAGGFLASIIGDIPCLSWLGGATSALSLGFNIYMLQFNLPDNIKQHTDAANELWDIREDYHSLIVDFDDLDSGHIREIRDKLKDRVSQINKKYHGTDARAFAKAQKDAKKYMFKKGEANKLLNIYDFSENKSE
ncbi:SLATT domain-containing protein [bacterium]|nr:SLATT domain-containing protein [bacterium]